MRTKVLMTVAAAVLVASQAFAADEKKNDLGVVIGYIAPMSDSTVGGVKTEADSTVDYGFAYKHRFLDSNRLSVGLNLLYADFDVKDDGQKSGTVSNLPILVDANWHLLANKNLYAGVTAGYSSWGDFKPEGGGGNTSIKSDFIYGLNAGYDIPIGDRFCILTNLRYLGLKAEPDVPNSSKLSVNPIVANVGFAWRF